MEVHDCRSTFVYRQTEVMSTALYLTGHEAFDSFLIHWLKHYDL